MVINCIQIANDIFNDVKKELDILKTKYDIKPKIVIIYLNNNASMDAFVNIKIKKATELGVAVEVVNHLKDQNELILYLKKMNSDKRVHGYLIQLPLPDKFNQEEVFEHININKDLDGLSVLATARNYNNYKKTFYPVACTAAGIMQIIKLKKYNLSNKHVVIVGRSPVIGKPLISMLLAQDATVTVCHSCTKNLNQITNQADVLITAIGKPNFFKKQAIKKNAFVIDAGISVINNKVIGDVDFKQVVNQAKAITPVPNGVGKITIAMLFKNLVSLIKHKIELEEEKQNN